MSTKPLHCCEQTLKSQPADAKPHQLLCRAYYAQEMADAAIHECELATANDPTDSDSQMWLGRAYGMKASTANPLIAFSLAKKVHVAFERAVQLDPDNVRAMSDLGEFYVARSRDCGWRSGQSPEARRADNASLRVALPSPAGRDSRQEEGGSYRRGGVQSRGRSR